LGTKLRPFVRYHDCADARSAPSNKPKLQIPFQARARLRHSDTRRRQDKPRRPCLDLGAQRVPVLDAVQTAPGYFDLIARIRSPNRYFDLPRRFAPGFSFGLVGVSSEIRPDAPFRRIPRGPRNRAGERAGSARRLSPNRELTVQAHPCRYLLVVSV
jgi:hypothetical protein